MTEDDEIMEGRYIVLPVKESPTPREGTIDQRAEAPRHKRMRTGWRRSSRGNLYKVFHRHRAVVICPNESRKSDEYSWVLVDDKTDLASFSPTRYGTEGEAWESLLSELRMREEGGLIRL
jgi:hypothetical protein